MAERYRRIPTEITAVQWDGTPAALERIAGFLPPDRLDLIVFSGGALRVKAGPGGESGWVNVPEGTWVAHDGVGDFWPIAPVQFVATYEPAELPSPMELLKSMTALSNAQEGLIEEQRETIRGLRRMLAELGVLV